jgi:hypothetical protein
MNAGPSLQDRGKEQLMLNRKSENTMNLTIDCNRVYTTVKGA